MASPLEASLTVPEALAYQAKNAPDSPFYVFPDPQGSDNPTVISFLEFDRATDRVAHLLRPNRSGDDGEVVAILGLADTIVYQAVVMGLMKAGLIPFPMSPRMPPAAIIGLLRKTNSHRLIVTQKIIGGLVNGVAAELKGSHPGYEVSIEELPTIGDLYPKLGKEKSDDPFQPYPPSPAPAVLEKGGIYLHSSGSTGMPKAINQTHLMLLNLSRFPVSTTIEQNGRPVRLAGLALPPFHTMGFWLQLVWPIYNRLSVSVYAPTGGAPTQPTPDNVLETTIKTKGNGLIVVPLFMQIWAQNPEAVEYLKSLEFVSFGGGPLASGPGDFLVSAGVKVISVYGGTEFGSPTILWHKPGKEKHWAWLEFSDRASIRWDPQGDGTFECQFLTTDKHTLAVENLEDVKGYATSDLFLPHPTEPNLWRPVGRKDDVLVHSTGEKTVPGPMEDIINLSPIIKGALMFGHDKDQPGLLVEPTPEHAIDVNDSKQVAELRNKLWPTIVEANQIAPAYSKLFKEMILITAPEKPLIYGGKGGVMRKPALAMYKKEIDGLYGLVDAEASNESVAPPKIWSESDLKSWLLEQAKDLLPGKDVKPDQDLFDQGLDSLSATIIRLRIFGALKRSENPILQRAAKSINQNTVYTHPTVDALASAILEYIADPERGALAYNHEEAITKLIEKYSHGLETPLAQTDSPEAKEKVVLLTGSTGNLGSDILFSLLENPSIQRIYALNRVSPGATSAQRQEERFKDKGLDTSLLSSTKLVLLEGDLSQPSLGVSSEEFDRLKDTVSIVIHNAWRLDFNLGLSSFESHVKGTRNLIDLARSGRYGSSTRFLFTSSIASAQSWDASMGPYPEEVVEDPRYAVGPGYGEGKYVAERILAKSGLRVTSLRIGQITGSTSSGSWSTTDWIPIIVQTSLTLGMIPDVPGLVSWIPLDAVTNAILDFSSSDLGDQPPLAANVVHPRPIPWSRVINFIRDALATQGKGTLTLVTWAVWIKELESRAGRQTSSKGLPALKLLDFFRRIAAASDNAVDGAEVFGQPSFATSVTQSVSAAVKTLEPLGSEHAERWVKYWIDKGL